MADDASYAAFLNKANQDLSTSPQDHKVQSTSQTRSKFDPTTPSSVSGGVPKSLSNINVTYVSDTDSEFEPVFFSYAGASLPSVKEFRQCLGFKGQQEGTVEELSVNEFDPRGEYKEVVEKVKEAGTGAKGVKIFRVEVDKTRVEYYILTVGEGGKLVGVVAKAVES